MKVKKVLCLFDYVARTGFGTVSKNIVSEITKHFGSSIQLDIVAINYFGEPYYESENVFVCPAKTTDVNSDDYGRFFFLKMLKESNEYDGIFICQDLGVIVPFIEVMQHIKKEKKEQNKKSFKSIFYFPVDCNMIKELTRNLEFFDLLVTYTEFARNEVLKFAPELKPKLKVVAHGNNSKHFYPIDAKDFRKEFFGANADKFIITNVNRNQPRKDIPNTIFGFIEAKEIWDKSLPEPFLYLHCHPKDVMGWDLRGIMLQTQLVEDVDYKLLPKEFEEQMCDIATLNKIYNASDCFISTTLGEGWGMCLDPYTKIITSNGTKDIKDVLVNDMVLGNDGSYHKVLDTTYRKVKSILHLKAKYGYNVKATHEHPYYVMSNGKECWKRVDELNKKDFVGIVKPIGDKILPLNIDLADYVPKVDGWVVEDFHIYHKFGFSPKKQDWSYSTICKKYNTTKKVVENARAYLSGVKKTSRLVLELANKMLADGYVKQEQVKIKRYISINDEILEVFGLYLADGSASNGKVEFGFNTTTKKNEVEKVKNVFIKYFGVDDISIRRRDKRYEAIVNSVLLEKIFSNLFGNGAYNKKIPNFLNGSEKSLMPLVKGFYRGDGHINLSKDTISFTTVSPSIAYQITSILASNNILASVNDLGLRPSGNYNIFECKIVSVHLRRYLDATKQSGVLGRDTKRQHKPDFIEVDTHFFIPIKSIDEIVYEQEVFDLCVEDSHSFVGNGIVCHNTYSESAAAKIPIVAPYNTSFKEMSGYGKNAWMLKSQYPYCNVNDNVIRQQTDIYEIADTLLEVAKSVGADEYKQKIENSYKWIMKLEWKDICKHWIEYFKIF